MASSPPPLPGAPAPPAANRDERERAAAFRRRLLDVSVGAGLALALLIVFIVDALTGSDDSAAPVTKKVVGEVKRVAATTRPPRLGVTPPEFDDMGSLLDSLGHGYKYETVPYRSFLEEGALKPFDVVFLTCGGVPTRWLSVRLRDSERGSAGVFRPKRETERALYDNLRDFVRDGGTLYVSDLHFDVLLIAFPEFVDEVSAGRGAVQTVEARVVDEGLRKQLGDTISLRFDMRAWRPAAFRRSRATVYLEGEYELVDGSVARGPLLVSFSYGKGTVIFTSFHNEMQNSDLEMLLLRYLVFATVTAREQETVRQVLVQGGFSPTQRNLLALTTEDQPVRDVYTNDDTGPLQFVLGFAEQGAELELCVTSPDGKRFRKSGAKTFSIQIEDAAQGPWTYSITPLKIPYRNFPFTLTVGEKTGE